MKSSLAEELLFRQLDYLISNMNEANESNILLKIKDKIKNFIENNLNRIIDKLPNIIDYVNNISFSLNIKKDLLYFIAMTLFLLGVNINSIKSVYKNKDVDNQIVWSDFQNKKQVVNLDITQLTKPFSLGDYNISFVNDFYDIIKKQISPNVKVLNGVLVVTISDDPQNPNNKNFANDDTPEDKAEGGKLLDKRLNIVKIQLDELKQMFEKDGIYLNIEIFGKSEIDRKIYFKSLVVEKEVSDNINYNDEVVSVNNTSVDNDEDINIIKPIGGGFKDISRLSRNYQFVELLKLGDINTERFNGDKGVDAYSEWIIDTRKHIKQFLTRLKENNPEYNIQFDKDTKAYTPIKGSQMGVSNADRQFSYVEERYILDFSKFNEGYNDDNDNDILKKWKKILGRKFPKLSYEQALNFDKNISTFLHYLEQMYGNSILNFQVIEN